MSSTLTPPQPTSAAPQNRAGTLFDVEPDLFLSKFSREPFLIDHHLADHPLFDLDRLMQLCRSLPERNVEYNAGDLPISISHDQTPQTGLSAEETIRRISECQSWLVLKWVEHDPEYRQLLLDCLSEIEPYTERIKPGMRNPQAFVFITSPGSVTPYHIDHEHNFLLQIRGAKRVFQFDGSHPDVLSEQELEDFYTGRGRNLEFHEGLRDHQWEFDLPAGQGLHFPVTFPHYVENRDEVSISFSITFRTADLDRRKVLYKRNAAKRAAGGTPQPVGSRPWRDSLSYQKHRVVQKLKRILPFGDD